MLKTNNSKLLDLDILTDNEVFDVINVINPELANLIQESGLARDVPFFRANYSYGEKIIYNKKVFLPLIGGNSISINDSKLPDSISRHLSYTPKIDNPVGMILNKESEFYTTVNERIVSYPIIKPGQIFGFAHIIDAVMRINSKQPKKAIIAAWNLDAGARIAFVLPKISKNGGHARLVNTYGIDVAKPEEYVHHRDVFRALNIRVEASWKQSILYFPKQFLHKLITESRHSAIYQEMSGMHRLGYNIWHSTYAKWESDINYVLEKTKANALPAYAVSIAKHIYLIVAGGVPGFVPATDDSMLPKEFIEKAYNTVYGLKWYWPTTMQPKQFTGEETIYYSLNLPTLILYNPETFKGKTVIELLYNVMIILCKCQEHILNEFEDTDSHLYETAITAKFSFYHDNPNPEIYGNNIKNSATLPDEDSRFYKAGFNFPAHNHFVRGCIKIEPV